MDGGLIPRKPVAAAPAPGQGLLAPGVVTGAGGGGGIAGMGDVLPPKRQAVVDRLRRRIENYRRRQSDCIPRFDQSFNGLCEQNIQETLVLKQRFLESKAKRAAKKTDKKQDNSNNLHTVRDAPSLGRILQHVLQNQVISWPDLQDPTHGIACCLPLHKVLSQKILPLSFIVCSKSADHV